MKKIILLFSVLFSYNAFSQTFFKDLKAGPETSDPRNFITHNGKMYFIAYDDLDAKCELWMSDGTPGGTHLVKDINPNGGSISPTASLISNGTYVFFVADDAVNGKEVWRSDGTSAGTIRVSNCQGTNASVADLTLSNGWVFFSSTDSNYGREIWKTNGSAAIRVTDINPGPLSSVPVNITGSTTMVDVNGEVYFTGTDGVTDYDVYKVTSNSSGASIVIDLSPNTLSRPDNLFAYNGLLLFTFDATGTGNELYVSDGTSAGTTLIDINPSGSSHPAHLTLSQGKVFFDAAESASGNELWMTDGTSGGTQLVKDVVAGPTGVVFDEFRDAGNAIYFVLKKGNTSEIWRSNGTAAGTYSVANDLLLSNIPYSLFSTSGFVLFAAQKASNTSGSISLYSINTANNRVFVLPNTDGTYTLLGTAHFSEHNGTIYFSGADITIGAELWTLDPTNLSILQGVPDLQQAEFSIFPNPVINELQINSEFKNAAVSLFNVTGELVLSKELVNESKINLENLPPNIYLLEIKSDAKIYRTKLIKE